MVRKNKASRKRIDGIADHDGPRANLPALDQAVYDVGVGASERLHDRRVVRAENEQGFIGGVGECAGEEEFPAIVSLARVAQVIVPEGAAALQIIINDIVDQREISHGGFLGGLKPRLLVPQIPY
jgi:hypothetical protein